MRNKVHRLNMASRVARTAFLALALLATFGGGTASAAGSASAGGLYGVDLSHPSGAIWLGGHLWTSDRLFRFCRIDPSSSQLDLFNMPKPTGVALPNQSAPATCPYGSAIVAIQPGQPAFDPVSQFVYVPDRASKSSVGVARYAFDPTTDAMGDPFALVFGDKQGQILAPTGGLAGLRPNAVALGPDGNLYVGSQNTGDIKEVTAPAGPIAQQTVRTIGKTSRGGRVFGMAFVGNDLYLAEKDGLTVIRNAVASTCTGGCQAVLLPGTTRAETNGLAADGAGSLYYVQSGAVQRYALSTSTAASIASTGLLTPDQVPATYARWYNGNCAGTTCPFAFQPGNPAALALDPSGNLYVGDDPDTIDANLFGRIWRISAP